MPESSRTAKMAAGVALRAEPIDEEAIRILLALNDEDFSIRLAVEAISQTRKLTPEAWKTLNQNRFRPAITKALHASLETAYSERNDRGAKQVVYYLTKLRLEKEEYDQLVAEALEHHHVHMAAWLMARPNVSVDRLSINRWVRRNTGLAIDLAEEIERQVESSGATNGKKLFLDGVAEDIRLIVKDNAELRGMLERATPDEIADALHNCLAVTSESIEALERFAWDRPECAERLVQLIQDDAKEIEDDGAPKAVGNFFRNLARTLSQVAAEAETAARIGG